MDFKFDPIFSDLEMLLSLKPEELAGFLIVNLNSGSTDKYCLNNIVTSVEAKHKVTHGNRIIVSRALAEAWSCLERDGLIAREAENMSSSWHFITRRGKQIKNLNDYETFRKAFLLPKDQLHPKIAEKVWTLFLRGDYDTAIFQAFKEIEIAVRDAGNYSVNDIGVPLMRNAFEKINGPLADKNIPEPEREALSHLFAGGMGYFRNPCGHRYISINDPVEVVDIIRFASYLLRVVDSRQKS